MGTTIATPGANAQSQGREITFDLNSAQPPINQYVGRDDQLFIMTSSSTLTVTVSVFARMMMPDGTLQQNQWTIAAPAQRSGFFTPIPLPECFLLSCSALVAVGNPNSVFVQATIARGVPGLGFQHLVLFKGYPSLTSPLSWPWGVNTTSVDCVGQIRAIAGTTPAAGAEVSETVPTAAQWNLKSFMFSFTASATVATRTCNLVIDDGTTIVAIICVASNVTAGASGIFTFGDGLNFITNTSGVINQQLLRDLRLNSGWRIRTLTTALQAGDQYSLVRYGVMEWLIP